MRSVQTATVWEMIFHRPWLLPFALAGGYSLPLLLHHVFERLFESLLQTSVTFPNDPNVAEAKRQFLTMDLIFTQIMVIAIGLPAFSAAGPIQRLFTLPITNRQIAWIRLVPAMVFQFIAVAFLSFVINSWFRYQTPIWGPAFFAATYLAMLSAVMVCSYRSIWMMAGLSIVGGAGGIWFKMRFGEAFSLPDHAWNSVTVGEATTMCLAIIASFEALVWGIGRLRRGEDPVSIGLGDWLLSVLPSGRIRDRHFRSPSHALFWGAWSRRGVITPAIVGILGTIIVLGWTLFSRDVDTLFEVWYGGGFSIVILALACGSVLGHYGRTDLSIELSSFLGTHPVTTRHMSRVLLGVMTLSVFAGWAIWAVPLALLKFGLNLPFTNELGWWQLPLILVASWTVASFFAALTLTGKSSAATYAVLGIVGAFIFTALIPTFVDVPTWYFETAVAMLALIITIGVLVSFVIGIQNQLVSGPMLIAPLLICVAFAAAITYVSRTYPIPMPMWGFLTAACALFVAPFATVPVALQWNRVR